MKIQRSRWNLFFSFLVEATLFIKRHNIKIVYQFVLKQKQNGNFIGWKCSCCKTHHKGNIYEKNPLNNV